MTTIIKTTLRPAKMAVIMLALCLFGPGMSTAQEEFIASHPKAVERMIELAKLTPYDVLYDLGSGDGRIVIAAAKKQARAVGIEIDPQLVALSLKAIRAEKLEARAKIYHQNFYQADLKPATVVTLFLSPTIAATLESKLRKELSPGAVVISNGSLIGGWKPDAEYFDGQILCNQEGKCRLAPIYVWRIK